MRRSKLLVVVTFLAIAAACARAGGTAERSSPPQQAPKQPPVVQGTAVTPESPAFAGFTKRVEQYLDMHNRLEKTLPSLPKETNPKVIDTHQRALGKLLQEERKAAKRGELFTPDAERAFRAALSQVFSGPDGKQLKASIMDENPKDVKLSVNARYPDEIPLSTVPPQVLASLPKLPTEVEYRFIGNRLILLDVHAHIVVDFIENALPA